jgi:hypothetical protein
MAVLKCEELLSGRTSSGRVREAWTYGREWVVQTETASTSMIDIINAPGVIFGSPHPDDPTVYAIEGSADPMSENPLTFIVKIKYSVLTGDQAPDDQTNPGSVTFYLPAPDAWSGSSSLTTVGTMKLPKSPTPGDPTYPVVNTADTLFTDVTVEQARFGLTLGRSYADMSFLSLMGQYTNAMNADAWAGGARHTWLCRGARWDKQTQTTGGQLLFYYRVTWEFEYNPDTWVLELNSVGFLERRDGGLHQIVDSDGEPVSEPRALDASGKATASGASPEKVKYYPHPERNFTATFGTPN